MSEALPRLVKATFIFGILPASLLLLLSIQSSHAGSATWNLDPTTGDWNTADNWTPATVPNGPGDTATFDVSHVTTVSKSVFFVEVSGIKFNPGASAFVIHSNWSLAISGEGIMNDSAVAQNFVAPESAFIDFTNSATAGRLTFVVNEGAHDLDFYGGVTEFYDTSSAGNCTITNNPA
jgi:hypothetical protein